jgi:PAS domain S-box-containing protein
MSTDPAEDDLFESAACGLLQALPDGTITRVNARFCEWLGFARDDLAGRPLQELFTVGSRLFYQTHWLPTLRLHGSVGEVKFDVVHRDGSKVPMLFNASQRARAGVVRVDVAAMVVRDRQKYERELVEARKVAEAARADLQRQNDRKDEFLATLAHELRNPLAPLRNGIGVLKHLAIDDARTLRIVDIFDRQVRQLTRLVDDLLDVSRITHGKLRLHPERIDLRRAIDDAVDAAMPAIDEAGHTFHLRLPSAPVVLYGDAAHVTQMVLNLLNNAARFTPRGGEIRLDVADGDAVTITVRDSGIGIPQTHLAWIFEMFSQVTPATQRAAGGLGIGLALVKGLAELHGGSIRAESAGAGQGSCFTLTLPHGAPAGDGARGVAS